jgi:hypothetical protein
MCGNFLLQQVFDFLKSSNLDQTSFVHSQNTKGLAFEATSVALSFRPVHINLSASEFFF